MQQPGLHTLKTLAAAIVAVSFLAPMTIGQANAASGVGKNDLKFWFPSRNHCSRTSVLARNACKWEVRDDYAISEGVCTNTEDEDERHECFFESWEDRWEATDECRDQFSAREEVCDMIGQDRYDPEYEPEDFEDPGAIGYDDDDVAPNPWFPLVPGTRWVYESEDEIITVEVLEDTMEVDGVNCTVVRDLVVEKDDELEEGEDPAPIEDTLDWYAQDKDGNVWYFGEIAVNYEDGQVTDVDGSWKAGEDGARPGILMKASPSAGDVFRQEWYLGDAEDMAEVVDTQSDPELAEDNVAGDCDSGCLQTLEWNPLEADSYEYKYYKPGIGMVQEVDIEEPENTVELIEFHSPWD